MQTITATSPDEFDAAVRAHPRLLVDFYKDNCLGCRMLDMALQKFASSACAQDVTLLKVKLETVGEPFFISLGLRQTPTLGVYRDGAEVARLPGFQSPLQIEAAIREGLS